MAAILLQLVDLIHCHPHSPRPVLQFTLKAGQETQWIKKDMVVFYAILKMYQNVNKI